MQDEIVGYGGEGRAEIKEGEKGGAFGELFDVVRLDVIEDSRLGVEGDDVVDSLASDGESSLFFVCPIKNFACHGQRLLPSLYCQCF